MLRRKAFMKIIKYARNTKSWPLFYINILGLFCFFLVLEGMKIQSYASRISAAVFLLLSIAVPIVLAEAIILKSFAHKDTGLDFKNGTKADSRRVFVKVYGLYATMTLIGLLYYIFPEYRKPSYGSYWILLKYLVPVTSLAAIPYFFLLDKYLVDKKDGYWHAGMFFSGQSNKIDRTILKNHILGWLVKSFFLPLMFTYLMDNLLYFKTHSIIRDIEYGITISPDVFYRSMLKLIFTIDLAYAAVGYLFTFRIFNSHIRSVEPTMLGWLVALICYQPFWGVLYDGYLSYNSDQINFDNWLNGVPFLLMLWAALIIFMLMVYIWATLQFGIRFSNLTHRGIITNGPYRYLKHPAYVSKNISWWLISVPFISNRGLSDAIKNCLLLFCVNLIYYLRAKTEEAHLGLDPVYQNYQKHMKENSIKEILKNVLLLSKPFIIKGKRDK